VKNDEVTPDPGQAQDRRGRAYGGHGL